MFRSPRHSVAAFAFLFLFASGVLAFGQGTRASINGAVRDTSGAVVPDAKLNLRSVSTTAVFSVTSAAEGLYDFPNLVAGVYELSVTAKGFREYIQKGITVNLDQQLRLRFLLIIHAVAPQPRCPNVRQRSARHILCSRSKI